MENVYKTGTFLPEVDSLKEGTSPLDVFSSLCAPYCLLTESTPWFAATNRGRATSRTLTKSTTNTVTCTLASTASLGSSWTWTRSSNSCTRNHVNTRLICGILWCALRTKRRTFCPLSAVVFLTTVWAVCSPLSLWLDLILKWVVNEWLYNVTWKTINMEPETEVRNRQTRLVSSHFRCF